VKTLGIVAMAFALGYHPTPARLGVSAQEFHLTLSRPSVKAGVLEIELQNDGEDPHDLRVRRVGSMFGRAATGSGARSRTTARSGCRHCCASAERLGACASA
jgi:hypothetical protein